MFIWQMYLKSCYNEGRVQSETAEMVGESKEFGLFFQKYPQLKMLKFKMEGQASRSYT